MFGIKIIVFYLPDIDVILSGTNNLLMVSEIKIN